MLTALKWRWLYQPTSRKEGGLRENEIVGVMVLPKLPCRMNTI